MAKGGFPGMGGANMQQLMKQAQKMQQDFLRMQKELEEKLAMIEEAERIMGENI